MNAFSRITATLVASAALALTFFGCDEQQAQLASNEKLLEAQTLNNEQRLLGEWVNEADGSKLVFNSDGTGTQKGKKNYGKKFKYGITSDKLAIVIPKVEEVYTGMFSTKSSMNVTGVSTLVFDLSFSNDDKMAIFTVTNDNTYFGNALLRKVVAEKQADTLQSATPKSGAEE